MPKREEVTRLLEKNDLDGLGLIAKSDHGLFRTLISLTDDKNSLISWRAIEAVGRLSSDVAATDPDRVRNLAQRLLWMLREESGNNPWSAPDMLGELVRNNPDRLADIAPIIASFHDEEILRQGVLRAMVRIGGVRPDLVSGQHMLISDYVGHPDPLARAYAVMLAGTMGRKDLIASEDALGRDEAVVRIYEDGEFRDCRISDLVRETLEGV